MTYSFPPHPRTSEQIQTGLRLAEAAFLQFHLFSWRTRVPEDGVGRVKSISIIFIFVFPPLAFREGVSGREVLAVNFTLRTFERKGRGLSEVMTPG